jgi:hypothetical protein
MRFFTSILTVAVAAILIVPGAGAAQKLEPGTWTGTVTPPDEPAVQVTYVVKVSGDTTSIQLNAAEHGTFQFREVKVDAGKLTFSWTAGDTPLKCTLARRADAAWAGTCLDAEGKTGQLVMIPPKK